MPEQQTAGDAEIRQAQERSRRDRRLARLNAFLGNAILHALAVGSLVILLMPIAWMLSTALKPVEEVFAYPPSLIPDNPTLDNFRAEIGNPTVMRLLFNSIVVGVFTAILATGGGAMAAYALSRFRFKGNQAVLLFFMASMAFPIPLIMISMYFTFVDLNLLNTYTSLIIGHTVITLPVAVWIMKNFFDQVPIEIEEAAALDGAGSFRMLWSVVMPMARSGLGASAIFVFVTSWNELLFGLTFASTDKMRPLPAGISLLFISDFEGNWQNLMAVAAIVSVPVMIMFLFFQRTFVSGVTAGAVKG